MANPEHLEQLKKGVKSWNAWREENPNIKPDLNEISLTNLDLKKANLQNIDLSKSNLNQVILHYADLRQANLSNVKFDSVTLINADLSNANLNNAKFTKTTFYNAKLNAAILNQANLRKSPLHGASFSSAILKEANLSEAFIDKADLSNADLSKANLKGANLENANLSKANLSGADLSEGDPSEAESSENTRPRITNLSGAKLNEANLNHANLSDAKLSNANLTGANFQNATLIKTNLSETTTSGTKFGGSDTTNATFPKEFNFGKDLEIFDEASRIARKHFGWLITGLVFSLLTIFSTDDVSLLTNSQTTPLPIIQTPIPLAGFYLVAPFLLVALYLYFHIQLQHNWRIVSRLPAIFPDGVPIDQKLFPWQLNMWCRNFFPLLNQNKKYQAKPRDYLIVFMTWWATPVVLFGFWLRYLPRHDWEGTFWHMFLLMATSFSALYFYRWAKKTFPANLAWDENDSLTLGFLIIFISFLFIFMSPPYEEHQLRNANFSGKDVSIKPDNWNPEKPTQGVKVANFEIKDLRFVRATNAFLAKLNLYDINFRKAILRTTNFENANFREVDFTEARLLGANFKNANFHDTNFSRASLFAANLEKSVLYGVNLTEANLIEANLSETFLSWTEHLKISKDTGSKPGSLIITDLTRANLTKANLQKAKLDQVNLFKSKFDNANLKETYFENVKNLTCAQLQSAYIDKKTKLPDYIKITGGIMGKTLFLDNEINIFKDYICEEIEQTKSEK